LIADYRNLLIFGNNTELGHECQIKKSGIGVTAFGRTPDKKLCEVKILN
jgi:hypothetical protein